MRIKVISNDNLKSNYIPIMAAEQGGTVYYHATDDELSSLLESGGANTWIFEAINFNRLEDIINLDAGLYGSKIIDDEIYLCVTDGHDINVNGENVDPESALDQYDIDELAAYIQPMTEEIAVRYITEQEMNLSTDMVDSLALDLIEEAGYSFAYLAKEAQEIGLI